MLVWRIAREIHCDTTLEGSGGLLVAGRWHRRGQPILYTSSSASLAALGVLVHVEPLQAPDDLRVPSVIVSMESNVLLNPRHPEIARVRISSNEAFRFDSRLR